VGEPILSRPVGVGDASLLSTAALLGKKTETRVGGNGARAGGDTAGAKVEAPPVVVAPVVALGARSDSSGHEGDAYDDLEMDDTYVPSSPLSWSHASQRMRVPVHAATSG
jgi:hypothetical protein